MYKLQSVVKIDSELYERDITLKDHIKDHIINNMCKGIADELKRIEAYELKQIKHFGDNVYNRDEYELQMRTYVISPIEYDQLIDILKLLKNIDIPDTIKGYISHIYKLVTQQPE